jgi:hypothetical protein
MQAVKNDGDISRSALLHFNRMKAEWLHSVLIQEVCVLSLEMKTDLGSSPCTVDIHSDILLESRSITKCLVTNAETVVTGLISEPDIFIISVAFIIRTFVGFIGKNTAVLKTTKM